VRRVVTGHDPGGTAVVLFDGEAANVSVRQTTGTKRTVLWTTNATPATFVNADRGAVKIGVQPPPGATILHVVEFPAHDPAHVHADHSATLAEMGIPPLPGRRPPRHPLMHATETVDYAIVLDGEIDMLLDDSEVHLRAGDVLVQQGTNHAWVNRSDRPCKIAFVLIDAAGSPLASPE
jgi:quercetin dioxygenase-like cupin family protein